MIELRQFRQFIAVAEELSFRRAAQRLHMAQPPLTAAIRKIESELGTTLIERTNRVGRLTEAGRVFLDEARRAVTQAERAVRAAQRAGKGLSGSLRVMFVPSAANDLLPRILRAFRDQHSSIELDLIEATTGQQVAALLEDRADLGFVMPPVQADGSIRVHLLYRSQLVAALPHGHRLAQSKSVSLSALAHEPWILFPSRHGPGLHGRIIAACAQAGFVPQVTHEARQMDTIASFVAGGMGVALVPKSMAALGRRGVVFRRLVGVGTPVDYELAIAYRQPNPVLDAFAAVAHAVARTQNITRLKRLAAPRPA